MFVAVGAGAYYLWDRHLNSDDEEPDEWTPEGSALAYSRGELYPRRARAPVGGGDGSATGVRSALERVDGVGPSLSGPIRAEFPGPEFIEGATEEELQEVHGVGEGIASALKERFS